MTLVGECSAVPDASASWPIVFKSERKNKADSRWPFSFPFLFKKKKKNRPSLPASRTLPAAPR